MNGTIVPSSSYGSGTTMKIILDQKYDTIDTDINKYDNIYDKKKVLLIDDSPSSEKLFNKILSGTNIELTSVKIWLNIIRWRVRTTKWTYNYAKIIRNKKL